MTENLKRIEDILEKKEEELDILQAKVNKIEENSEKSINEQVLKLSEVVIANTVKAVVTEFEKKQGEFEKINSSKLDTLHDQIVQLSTLVLSVPKPSSSKSRDQLPKTHPQQAPRGPPWSAKK